MNPWLRGGRDSLMSGHDDDIIGEGKRVDEKEEGRHKLQGEERWGAGEMAKFL